MRQQHGRRLPNWAIALILIGLLAIGTYYAFVKEAPWAQHYEVQAIFPSAQNVRTDSPVRIAGVNVGKVSAVEQVNQETQETVDETDVEVDSGDTTSAGSSASSQSAAIVTMQIEDQGRPIKSDATFRLLPRLFLEGNLFVDLKPGSPSAGEVDENHVFPLDQTSNSVQLDQILTTLQSDVRDQLQIALEELGSALVDHGGAKGFQELYRSSPGANRFTSQVNEAFLGNNPHDLSGLIRNLDKVVRGLGRNEEALKDLVTNFRIFAGAFAAEDQALEQAIVELPRVFESGDTALSALNRSFPPLRAFAREALPGTESAPAALDAATPLLRQVRKLVSKPELRGLVHDLEPTVEHLAEVSEGSPETFGLVRAFSSCFNEVIIPWQNDTVPAIGHPAVGRVYEESAYGLVGIGGESRSGDANGQYIRTQAGGGANTVVAPNPAGVGELFGVTPFPILNSEPSINDSVKPTFEPDEDCERQEPPNLSTRFGGAPEQNPTTKSTPGVISEATSEAKDLLTALGEAQEAAAEDKSRATKSDEREAISNWTEFLDDYTENTAGRLLGGGGE